MKQEFLQLAHTHNGAVSIIGWLMSEKLDGMRAFWDGGCSRGKPKSSVPWANTLKDARYVSAQVATGLWSRAGHVIHAPAGFLDQLPVGRLLDGELYCSDMPREELFSRLKRAGSDWTGIKLYVFDSPPLDTFAANRELPWTDMSGTRQYLLDAGVIRISAYEQYHSVYEHLLGVSSPVISILEQVKVTSMEDITAKMGTVEEGVMVRHPDVCYETCRSRYLLKIKHVADAEGTVVGYVTGEGKLSGLMGALILRLSGGQLMELSGFTDEERMLTVPSPGPGVKFLASTRYFGIGDQVTFKYQCLSNTGIPLCARYWRKRS